MGVRCCTCFHHDALQYPGSTANLSKYSRRAGLSTKQIQQHKSIEGSCQLQFSNIARGNGLKPMVNNEC